MRLPPLSVYFPPLPKDEPRSSSPATVLVPPDWLKTPLTLRTPADTAAPDWVREPSLLMDRVLPTTRPMADLSVNEVPSNWPDPTPTLVGPTVGSVKQFVPLTQEDGSKSRSTLLSLSPTYSIPVGVSATPTGLKNC